MQCRRGFSLLALALAVCDAATAEIRDPNEVAVTIGSKDYEYGRVLEVAFTHRDAEAFKRYVLDVLGLRHRLDPLGRGTVSDESHSGRSLD